MRSKKEVERLGKKLEARRRVGGSSEGKKK